MRRSVKREEERYSARARDERGVLIWAELRMRAGESTAVHHHSSPPVVQLFAGGPAVFLAGLAWARTCN